MILPSKKVFYDHEKGDSLGTCKIFGQCYRGPCCFSWNLEKSGCPQHFPGIPVATWVCKRNITKKHMDMYWYESNIAVTVDLELVSESHTQVFPHTVNKKKPLSAKQSNKAWGRWVVCPDLLWNAEHMEKIHYKPMNTQVYHIFRNHFQYLPIILE